MATAQRQPVLGPSQGLNPTNNPLTILPKFDFSDTTLFAVFVFVRNFIGVSNCTSAAIDIRIQQAMDLVRTNLMYTLREEVIVLRQNLAELNARIEQLEIENQFLRENAEPGTIMALESLLARKSLENIQNMNQIAALENGNEVITITE